MMQLVAYGAQDVYLTANPQITFFKQLYKRHSNFAMEAVEQPFNGAASFGYKVSANIGRNGDLIHRMYLQATLPTVDLSIIGDASGDQFRWLNYVGHLLIANVEVEVGGQRIDKHYGDWLHIWNELTCPAGKQMGYAEMVGNVPELVNIIQKDGPDGGCPTDCGPAPDQMVMSSDIRSCIPEYTLYIPLQFWFTRHSGLSLPLIALQYHEVRVNVEFNDIRNLCWSNNPNIIKAVNNAGLAGASLYVDYIFLDTEERRRFAQVAHEYLIEQLQFTGEESVTGSSNKIKMSFNHPVKEIIWVVQRDSFVSYDATVVDPWYGQQPFNYTDNWDQAVLDSGYSVGKVVGLAGCNPTALARIILNGQDRMSDREGRYYNLVQPWQHHTNIPATGINIYSFSLHPEDHQPSGTCNFSRIDQAQLSLILTPNITASRNTARVRIYALNYNILRVVSGMGGLAYSN